MLNPRRERIQDDLRGLVDGDVFANTVETQVYATDASLYEIQPLCVVCPKTTMDVVSAIRYARKNGLSIHSRGAGSNCVGASLGEGIILDMARYMRRLLRYQPETNILHVQAGMQCSRLNELLRPHRRQLLPGSGNSWPNTIGGLLSMDGYGSRWLAFGRPSDWLLELELVTANGNIVTFTNQETVSALNAGQTDEHSPAAVTSVPTTSSDSFFVSGLPSASSAASAAPSGTGDETKALPEKTAPIPDFSLLAAKTAVSEMAQNVFSDRISEKLIEQESVLTPEEEKKWILSSVASLLNESREHLRKNANRVIDKMGYRTNIQNGNLLNMARLIAGSEGTLGVITAVKLQLPEIPVVRKTLLLFFASMEKAMQAVPLLLPFHPEACELIDRRYLHLATERDVRFDSMFSAETEAALLVELSDTSQFSMLNRIRAISDQFIRQKDLAFQLISSIDETEASFFWELAGTFEPSVQYGKGKPVRITIVEDAAVTPAKLYDFFLKIQELLRKHGMTAAFYAHAVQGQVRLQPLADLHSHEDAARVMRFARDYYQLVHSMNGTIGTENGLGLGWKFWLPIFQHKKHELTCKIKQIFDPSGLFQPGKMGSRLPEKAEAPESFWRFAIRPSQPFPQTAPLKPLPPSESGGAENESDAKSEAKSELAVSGSHRNSRIQSVLDEMPHDETKMSDEEQRANESGIFVMEKVREILGNAFDEFTDESYSESERPQKNSFPESDDGGLESLTRLGLEWDSAQIQQISSRCNGCAKCRGTGFLQRTCPIFRYDCNEFSSPRAKASLMEGILNEKLDLAELGDEAFHSIIHRCFQCHSCRIECPSGVDVPFLVRRAEEAWARARGLNFYETSLVRLDVWLKRFQRFPCLANLTFSVGWLRWLLEKTFGIARERALPHLEIRPFTEKIRRNPALLAPNPFEVALDENPIFFENSIKIQGRVVYFPDTYANYFDSGIAQATVDVFRENQVPVVVPQHLDGSGITAVMLGRSDFVRKQVYRNAARLADYIRQGYDVVVTEPATTLAFRWEFPQTYPENEDVALVAKHCYDVGEYLYHLHVLQLLKMPQRKIDLKVGYHAPCRLKALKIGLPFVHLMGLIPGLEVHQSPHGCCGMGGTYGMMAENYSASQKIGRPLQAWLRNPLIQVGATECSACKIQMSQNCTKPILHPIRLLAQAYGLED